MLPLNKNKIINDPVYGFLTIPSALVYDIIQHPYFQRLRRIRQLGFPIFVNTAVVLPRQKTYWLDERHHIDRQLNKDS